MVVKEWIELLEDYLQGGDAPVEVRSKYDHRVLKHWTANAMLLLLSNSKKGDGSTNITGLVQEYGPYSIAENSNGKYVANLTVAPIGGPETVFSMRTSNGDPISLVRPGAEAEIMGFLKGCGCRASLSGNSLIWNSNPGIDEIYVSMIPELRSMEDTDAFNLPGEYRARIFEIIVSFLMKKKEIVEDVKNDQVDGIK